VKIKAIIFDMDGVLIDADRWHFNALNTALQVSNVDPISWEEHLGIYKGIPTKVKLKLLAERKGLDLKLSDRINKLKQEVTEDIVARFSEKDPEKIEMLQLLKKDYKLVVCSNAISSSIKLMLDKAGLLEFFDFFLSNEDVTNPKPSPEIYNKAISLLNLSPEEVVIVEDSDVGKAAAKESGACLCSVLCPSEVNYYSVKATILNSEKVNVVIPAAGQGKRFSEAGYTLPKPLIDVKGAPMLSFVLNNFDKVGRKIVLMQDRHIKQYRAKDVLKHYDPDILLVPVEGLTEGAASTVLLSKEFINNSNELILVNSDQYVDFDMALFVDFMRENKADGGILTFKDTNPKWSFAKCSPEDPTLVTEVAEKNPISDNATVGIYYFKQGKYFVEAAEQMISKNIRVNNEFYVCPVFNEMIVNQKKVLIYNIDKEKMWGLGTPEDLNIFLGKK